MGVPSGTMVVKIGGLEGKKDNAETPFAQTAQGKQRTLRFAEKSWSRLL
jgi:hypothetical protein